MIDSHNEQIENSDSQSARDNALGNQETAVSQSRKTGRERTVEASPEPTPSQHSRRSRGPKKLRITVFALVGAVAVFVTGTVWGNAIFNGSRRLWQDLAGADHEVTAAADVPGELPNQFWTCGMHPWVILPEPGLCPVCHMDLTPLDPAKLTGEIAIDPVVVQNIGVRVGPVTTGPLTKEIRTVGTIAYDEGSVRDMNTKVPGWIEKLYVQEAGAFVRKGEPLFELYSPELYQAQEEYLLALKGRRSLTRRLRDSARTKLEYYDISPKQIAELERRGKAKKTLTVTSPHTGVVIEKHAHAGMRIEPGTRVYRFADLSTVWAIATLYEYQLPYIEVGQPAVMALPYLPGKEFRGEVAHIYPYLQAETRQVKVRLEFPNPDRKLKPGMFANIEVASTLEKDAVLAPREAVIATGKRQVAFVSLGEGKFEPREVQLGAETDDGFVQILEGLQPGERVVTSGQFLLDSESKMRAALAKMVRGQPAVEQTPASPSDNAIITSELPPAAEESLSGILEAYFAVGNQLTAKSTGTVAASAQRIVSGIEGLTEIPVPGKPDSWKESPQMAAIRAKAAELTRVVGDLDSARRVYADLSHAMAVLLQQTGVPAAFGRPVEILTCPMYPPQQGGAVWLQPSGAVRNPYMGQGAMLRCSGDREALPMAGSVDAETRSHPGASSYY